GTRSDIWEMLFQIAFAISMAVAAAKPPISAPCPHRPAPWVIPTTPPAGLGFPPYDNNTFHFGRCLLFVNKPKMTCKAAQEYCEDRDATLVEIDGPLQHQWCCDMIENSRGARYVGAKLYAGGYVWISTYYPIDDDDLWCPNQPDNHTNETCVVIRNPNRDPDCCLDDIPDKPRKFICMENRNTAPT
ncbi:hypothetical protein ScPMuIL_009939, partial [Solemya velum]